MLNPNPLPSAVTRESGSWQSTAQTAPASANNRVESSTLLRGSREMLIAHSGQEYRLRLTRNDKLILTK